MPLIRFYRLDRFCPPEILKEMKTGPINRAENQRPLRAAAPWHLLFTCAHYKHDFRALLPSRHTDANDKVISRVQKYFIEL